MKYIAFLLLLVLASCAAGYKPIASNFHNYQNINVEKSVEFSYRYGILKERGNKKYAKKETDKNIKIVAVRVTNNSEEDFVFGVDKHVYSGYKPVSLLEPSFVFKELRQNVPIYLLFLLLSPMQFTTSNNGVVTNSTRIGLIIGPGLTALNMGIAGSANNKFKTELEMSFLNGREIKAGTTVDGLIGITERGYNPLILK